jgi:hypothetical protein
MRWFFNYKYVSLSPLRTKKTIYNLDIKKAILDVGFLLFRWFRPV